MGILNSGQESALGHAILLNNDFRHCVKHTADTVGFILVIPGPFAFHGMTALVGKNKNSAKEHHGRRIDKDQRVRPLGP